MYEGATADDWRRIIQDFTVFVHEPYLCFHAVRALEVPRHLKFHSNRKLGLGGISGCGWNLGHVWANNQHLRSSTEYGRTRTGHMLLIVGLVRVGNEYSYLEHGTKHPKDKMTFALVYGVPCNPSSCQLFDWFHVHRKYEYRWGTVDIVPPSQLLCTNYAC